VKIVSRHVYLGDLDRLIDHIKTNAYALVHPLIDFGGLSGLEKIRQRLALEGLDHIPECNRIVYVNSPVTILIMAAAPVLMSAMYRLPKLAVAKRLAERLESLDSIP
jgi:hypothetical protein